jgi:hypothetical protein
MQDYKRNAFIEADIQCLNAIQNMERKLKAACQVDGAKIERVVIVCALTVFCIYLFIYFEVLIKFLHSVHLTKVLQFLQVRKALEIS